MSFPDPMTPADCDLRDFQFMPLDIARLFGSEFHARASDGEWRAGLTLWLKSYHQVPAGSLPDDDVALARLAEYGRDLKSWRAVKDGALHGWVKCSDGRLYHPVVAEKALEGWLQKLHARLRGGKGNAKRWKLPFDAKVLEDKISEAARLLRELNPSSTIDHSPIPDAQKEECTASPSSIPEASSEQSTEDRKGQGQGQRKDQELAPQEQRPTPESEQPPPAVRPKRGSRLPEDWTLPDDWLAWALAERPEFGEAGLRKVGESFGDHWRSATGKNATKLDWFAAWRNWVRNQRPPFGAQRAGPPPASPHLGLDQTNHEEGLERQADGTYRIARP